MSKLKKALAATGMFEFEKTPVPVAAAGSKQEAIDQSGVAGSVPSRPVSSFVTSTPTNVAADPEIVSALNQTAASSKKPAYDVFKAIFDAMAGIPDSQRYQMALNASAAAQKVSASDVIASLDDRLSLLDRDASDFEKAWDGQVSDSVTSVQAEIEKIEATVETKKAEIRDLDARRISLAEKAGQAQVKLERDRATFNVSFEVVRSSYAAERERIAAYLAPSPVTAK